MTTVPWNREKTPPQDLNAAATTANDGAARAAAQKVSSNTTTKTFGCDYSQIFSPIEINKSPDDITDKFPSFQKVTINKSESGGGFASRTRTATDGGVVPYAEDLDPYFFTGGNEDPADTKPIVEGKIDFSTVHNKGDGEDLAIRKNNTIDQVNTVGLKGPMLMSGWGYDIADKPVPRKEETGDDSFRFPADFAGQRSDWKTGPVHLLWDEERQVWAGGLPMLMGVATSDIEAPEDPTTPTTFTMQILRKGDDGAEPPFITRSASSNGTGTGSKIMEEVKLQNFDPSLSQKMVTKDRSSEHDWEENPSLVWVLAIKMNYTWIPFYVGCPPECAESLHCVNLYKDDEAYKDREGVEDAVNWECEDGECVFNDPEPTSTGPGGGVTSVGGGNGKQGDGCDSGGDCGPGLKCFRGTCVPE